MFKKSTHRQKAVDQLGTYKNYTLKIQEYEKKKQEKTVTFLNIYIRKITDNT